MKISISVSSIWYKYGDEFRFLENIRACGFKYVDYDFYSLIGDDSSRYMGADWRRQTELTRNCMERLGMRAVQAHAPKGEPADPRLTDGILRRTERALECAQMLGIPQLVYHPGALPGMTKQEYLRFNLDYARRLLPAMERTGIILLLENVGRWDEPFYTHDANEMLELIELVNHPLYHACLDTGHLSLQDGAQYDTITRLDAHLKALHVQDNFGSLPVPSTCRPWRQDLHLPPLMGRIPFDEVLQGLKDIGFEGYFNAEVESPRVSALPAGTEPCAKPLNIMPEALTREFYSWVYKLLKYILREYQVFEE